MDAGVFVGSRHVVDVPALLFVVTDEADRRRGRERDVDVRLHLMTRAPVTHLVGLEVVARRELGWVRLVGDDADRARLGTRAIQGTLGPFENLDPLDVIEMNIGRAVDGGHRLLIEIGADARLRS